MNISVKGETMNKREELLLEALINTKNDLVAFIRLYDQGMKAGALSGIGERLTMIRHILAEQFTKDEQYQISEKIEKDYRDFNKKQFEAAKRSLPQVTESGNFV